MQQVNSSQAFSFVYPASDEAVDLIVAGRVYDVSSGTPVLLSTVTMALTSLGLYAGDYTGIAGKTYLVITAVYSDLGYTTPDTDYAPWAECYSCGNPGSPFLAFNYAAFDQDASLEVGANIFDTTGVPSFVEQVAMPHVALGVYFGSKLGVVDKAYSVSTVVYTDEDLTIPDTSRAPGSDVFQCYQLVFLVNVFTAAVLKVSASESPTKIAFTQGDTALLTLIAENGAGDPVNLVDAVFTTYIKGPNGVVDTFPNSQHTILDEAAGKFELALSSADTASCGLGENKEILTKIVQGTSVIYYRGIALLTVNPPVPLQ